MIILECCLIMETKILNFTHIIGIWLYIVNFTLVPLHIHIIVLSNYNQTATKCRQFLKNYLISFL